MPSSDDYINNDGPHQAGSSSRTSWLFPVLNFLAFFANFVFVDMHRTTRRYDTVLTPVDVAFLFWVIIWVWQFAFVSYQLFYAKPRQSNLIQRQLSLPWIFHQVIMMGSLFAFERQQIYTFAALVTVLWLLSLFSLTLITDAFRSESYDDYSTADYFLLEIPFALLLGWETVATLISWNLVCVKVHMDHGVNSDFGIGLEVGAFAVSSGLIVAAAVLYAGLPLLVNPSLHIPIVWGLLCIGWRWSDKTKTLNRESGWATPSVLTGVEYTSWALAAIVSLFCIVALAITISSRLCLPASSSTLVADDLNIAVSRAGNPPTGRLTPPSPQTQPSPRTARSALSAERV